MLSSELTSDEVVVEDAESLVGLEVLVAGYQFIEDWTAQLSGNFFEKGSVDHEGQAE